VIIADKISKHYRDAGQTISVFDDLSFTIERGQCIALMGESGAGKSTLLHILGGFDRVDAGSIHIDGQAIHQLSDSQASHFRRRHLGMVFQQKNLIPSLKAKDNISFIRRLCGLPAEDDYTAHLIEVFKLGKRLNHYPGQLSGGEQQRVAIARALAARPSLIMADEPTGNLDEHTAAAVMEQFMAAVKIDHSTLLLVTHSPTIAAYLGQCWRLENGRLHMAPTH
jgi:putative ABC transport system ATP-binding protein